MSDRAFVLLSPTRDRRLRPMTREVHQTFAHAALAMLVASWEAYLEAICHDFHTSVGRAADMGYRSMHSIAVDFSTKRVSKFNTPSAENGRELLIELTGFDPLNAWEWPAAGMNGLALRTRLNEVLKIRHAFAHGFDMPSYAWNTTPQGDVKLTQGMIEYLGRMLNNLVSRTDSGMRAHIQARYGVMVAW